jgi:hypothetical protein
MKSGALKMTAINIVVQQDRLHIASDGAVYTPDGTITDLQSKVIIAPAWPGAIASRGIAVGLPLVGNTLIDMFSTFDELIDGVESEIEGIVDDVGIAGHQMELFLAGWSSTRDRPEAYQMLMTDDLPRNCTEAEAALARANGYMPDGPFRLLRLPNLVMGPPPTPEISVEAFYEGIDCNACPADVVKSLRKVLEMQRHDKRDDGIHWCGGFGELTTVTANGVHQEILQRWPDVTGRKLRTLPIDWHEWCSINGMTPSAEAVSMKEQIAELERQMAPAIPAGLSRPQRERMEKKARKGNHEMEKR